MQLKFLRTMRCQTQLEAIRELMVAEAFRGGWLTLAEIAACTGVGEASVSAQLRHLRKACHGSYCVKKRLRQHDKAEAAPGCEPSDRFIWEYRVVAPIHAEADCMTAENDDAEGPNAMAGADADERAAEMLAGGTARQEESACQSE
jgi:hypothetical protein